MSDQNPYDKLGVSEDATFDEIQDVRNRLMEQLSGDAKQREAIEAAYDAILMDRLRMRQEGKIKVPERIRFPERLAQAPPKENSTPAKSSPAWLQRLLDTPSKNDVLIPGSLFVGLSAMGLLFQAPGSQVLQLVLVAGIGISIYFLNRKEGKFGRAVLLTLTALIFGLIAGEMLGGLLLPQIAAIGLLPDQFAMVVTFILLWLVTSFLR